MQKALLLFVFISSSILAVAQTGSISGTITDAKTKEAIIGGSVLIQGTQTGTSTDLEGNFVIKNLKPGTYTLQISYIAYQTAIVPNVVVEVDKISDIKIEMQEEVGTLEEVVITGERSMNTDMSIVRAIRESKLVVSGISAEQIVKLPDSDAAQVAQRVPGVTIVDNRFVMVRGVPERYNQVMINDALAPSTEIDRRSFSFDLIPSSSIDQMLIYKSGQAELPGDFAGGVIRMVTKEASDEEYTSFGFNTGYRIGTSLQNFNKSQTSPTDFLGFDNGFRSLPNSFPTTAQIEESVIASDLRSDAGHSLRNSMGYSTVTAPLDFGLNFGLARNLNIGNVRASNVTALSYSRNFQSYDMDFTRYNERRVEPNADPVIQFDFNDRYSKAETKVNLVHNWLFDLGPQAKIKFKNLAVQIGEDQTMLRSGYNNYEQVGKIQNNNAYRYLSRFIYSGQLEGKFKSANEANTYSVLVGANYINRNEPDYRRFRRVKLAGTDDPFELLLSSNSSPIDAGRFYSTLEDVGLSHAFNFEHKFGETKSANAPSIKAGYYLERKTRDFNARYITYIYPEEIPGFTNERKEEIIRQPLDQLFSRDNMFTYGEGGTITPGLVVTEGTRVTDRYRGENLYAAGYVSGNYTVGIIDLAGGFRLEHNVQKLHTQDGTGPVNVNNPITSPLPFMNVAVNLNKNSLIRTAYSRTVNRPEFRELARFGYYQFELDANTYGDEKLKTATIDNIDLRYEVYPSAGELISVGTFYKRFKDPIEFSLVNVGGLGQNFSYTNAPEAYSYGVEIEIKKSLASLSAARFFRNTSVNINASIIKSEVDMGDNLGGYQARFRPLQGQSPYVVNGNVYYNDPETGWSVNVGYNVFGKRIMAVGSVILPTWWEMPRNVVDVQVAKTIRNMEIKLNVNNLLDAKYRVMQDDNLDSDIDNSIDQFVRGYRTGQLVTLSVGWKLARN